jgi:hypothetical protein
MIAVRVRERDEPNATVGVAGEPRADELTDWISAASRVAVGGLAATIDDAERPVGQDDDDRLTVTRPEYEHTEPGVVREVIDARRPPRRVTGAQRHVPPSGSVRASRSSATCRAVRRASVGP